MYCVETANDMAIVATECEWEIVPKPSNNIISSDLECPEATFQGFNDRHSYAASLRQLSFLFDQDVRDRFHVAIVRSLWSQL